jgi:hypothetical protein
MSDVSRVLQTSRPQLRDSTTEVQNAQRYVGAAMVSCLGFWFAPVVSGVACSFIEASLIDKILKIMGCYSKAASEKVYWFFRQKTLFLFGGTYLPFAGVPLQLFETYGLGQFAIHCALRPDLLTDDAWLEKSWKDVEPDIFSGEHAIQSYEQFTGKGFPEYARKRFVTSVNIINQLYLASQKFPGAVKAQEGLAKMLHGLMNVGKRALKGAGKGTADVVAVAAMSIFGSVTDKNELVK